MKTKLLLILVSLAVLTTSLSAQSQDSRNSAFYLSTGYSRLDYKFNYDNIINGINVGAGYFGQIGNTGLFWDGSATFTYGIKEGKINNTKTTSITGAVNLLCQIKLSNIVSLFPYAGPALKYFIYGRTKPLLWSKEGASEFSQYYPWFGDESRGYNRVSFGVQAGLRLAIRGVFLSAEYQPYLTELNPKKHKKITAFNFTVGFYF
ncbi:MAG: outer membrane beta-barrel protein [Bacteroidales bacterium]|nr:outer membrane beta-barrel protein [Bacteroidales bacterium]